MNARFPSLALAVALAACQSPKADTSGQVTKGFYAVDYGTLWEVAQTEIDANGFVPNLDESSKENRVLVSRWRTSLQPFAFKGYREQATLTFHPVPGQADRWTVEANVLRQVNRNAKEPSNPIRADWDAGTRVPDKERKIVHDIESFFMGHDVSPEFRARYGMPSAPVEVPPPPRAK